MVHASHAADETTRRSMTDEFDFCTLGMKIKNKLEETTATRKKTAVMTNSQAITLLLREAQRQSEHSHTPLLGGRAGPCQEYPSEFCSLVCEKVKREVEDPHAGSM